MTEGASGYLRKIAAAAIAAAVCAGTAQADPMTDEVITAALAGGFVASDRNDAFGATVCQLTYEALVSRGSRQTRRERRTVPVFQGYRGQERLGPFIAAATAAQGEEELHGMRSTAERGLHLIRSTLQPPEGIDPLTAEVAALSMNANACDVMLSAWGAAASTAEPPGMMTVGGQRFPEFRLANKPATQVFAQPADAAVARAACEADEAGIDAAIAAGANASAKGLQELTPLMWAVSCENLGGVEALLKAGASPNQKAGDGPSAMTFAAGQLDPALLKLLLRYGGDPNAEDGQDLIIVVAYERASLNGDWRTFNALIDGGADVSRESLTGATLVYLMMLRADYARALQMLERGYSGDPMDIAEWVQFRLSETPDREARRQLEAIQAWCHSKGVRFPLPTRPVDNRAPQPARSPE